MIDKETLIQLKSQLEIAIGEAALSGDLTRAYDLRAEIERKFWGPAYELEVDYDQSISELIEEMYSDDNGKNFVDTEDINKFFYPSTESGQKRLLMYLFDFTGSDLIETSQVLAAIERRGFRPATLKELLTFCCQQRDFSEGVGVAALGSVCQDERHARDLTPIFTTQNKGFSIYNVEYQGEWAANYWRFAAVKK